MQSLEGQGYGDLGEMKLVMVVVVVVLWVMKKRE